jgi:glycosyltransferase involved in cell wall biosynthesis
MMDAGKARLLIHHHAVVYSDENTRIWIPSFIGRWVDALAVRFREIALLMHQSKTHFAARQDHQISRENVHMVSMGPPGRGWDRVTRMRRIKAACLRARVGASGLLIRGITPRQHSVWRWVGLKQTAFLLVGTPGDVPTAVSEASLLWRLYETFMRRYRLHELARISRHSTMLANSPGLVAELNQKFACQAQFVPTNSISCREFPPLNPRPISSPLRLLFCGRVVEDKGIREAIEAVATICRSGRACLLDVVGPLSPEYHQRLYELTASFGVQGAVNFHGFVPYGTALFEFYRGADFFVLPTYHEGFPHVLWEAAAHSCPLITSEVGGIPALLKHETHALLVPPRNPGGVSDAILRLIGDDALRQRLIRAAYGRAMEFTLEACAEKLSNILAECWN